MFYGDTLANLTSAKRPSVTVSTNPPPSSLIPLISNITPFFLQKVYDREFCENSNMEITHYVCDCDVILHQIG